jgi:histidinol-phosphatase (PHP family)
MNPGPEMLAMMSAKGIPVVLGSDAHTPERVAADFEFALDELSAAGFEEINYFNERKRVPLKIEDVRKSLCDTEMSSTSMV